MAKPEYLDVFNDNFEHLGTASRDEVHSKGYWHQTFHCWLMKKEGDRVYVLFQRRGPDKKLYPNTLDITAAGHLTAGESPTDGVRELNEELGTSVTADQLIYLGHRHDVAIVGAIANREFCHVYLLNSDMPLESYKLQPDEVTGLVQIELNDGLRLFSKEVDSVHATGLYVDAQGVKHSFDGPISLKDVIPRLDRYYLKVFIAAERYFEGKRYLAV